MAGEAGSSSNKVPENLLTVSWHDSAWIPVLSQANVMDYFSERSNPFYERTCNNEILKMQKLGVADVQLQNMQGTEYQLLHVQEPILYVVRKQIRHSPTQVTPVTDYYIVAGVVYQAPDLGTLLNSRIITSVSHLQSAFEEARSYSRYHPSRGYWWDFGKDKESEKKQKKAKVVKREEPSSLFQRRRVDMLLDLLTRQFPHKTPAAVESRGVEEEEGGGGGGPAKGEAEGAAAEKAETTIGGGGVPKSAAIKRERGGGGGATTAVVAATTEEDGAKPDVKRMKVER